MKFTQQCVIENTIANAKKYQEYLSKLKKARDEENGV